MIAEGSGDDFAGFPGLHGESGLFEFGNHDAAGEEAQVAVLGNGPLVIGILPHQGGEILARLDFGQYLVGALPLALPGRRIGVQGDLDQDMGGLDLLGNIELVEIAPIVFFQILVAGDNLSGITGRVEKEVAQGHRFGKTEILLGAFEEGLEPVLVDPRPILEAGRRQPHEGEVDLFILPAVFFVDIGIADYDLADNRLPRLFRQQLLALTPFELLRGQALISQYLQITVLVEGAVFLKGGHAGDGVDQLLVADLQPETGRLAGKQHLLDEHIERLAAQSQLFLQLRSELFAVDVLIKGVEIAVGRLIVGETDRVIVNGHRHAVALGIARVAGRREHGVADDETEDDNSERQFDEDRFLLFPDQIQHAGEDSFA